MKLVVILCTLIVGSFSVPTERPSRPSNGRINNEALLEFGLLVTKKQGGNTTEFFNALFPNIMSSNLDDLEYEKQLMLLATGGFTREFSDSILRELMPLMVARGKSTQEQLVTLMFLSNQFCSKHANDTSSCPEDPQALLPLAFMPAERGCSFQTAWPHESNITESDMCLCDEQEDTMFWLNLFEKLWQKDRVGKTNSLPDQFPMALIMALREAPCSGKWKSNTGFCYCQEVTRGHEPLFMQYLLSSQDVQEKLTPSQLQAVRNMIGTPSQRVGGLEDFIFGSLSGSLSPQLLSLLQNQGESSDAQLMQLILSTIGLDNSLVHIILNDGFQDNDQKVALINYLTQSDQIDTSILPFLLGVDNGREFFLSNLLEAGSLDPTVALLLLGNQNNTPQEKLLELLIKALSGKKPGYLDSLGRPYIPSLPAGVFPGSQLFFAHFETLDVNSCALHDLRNRYDCGYIGITAHQCETKPYCCYNPIFLTDEEVRAATDNAIQSVLSVPWCYYNIFFVYYEDFYLEVKKPGQFASPIQCEEVFKYGLELDPTLFYLADSNPAIGKLINKRVECGFPGITEFHCVAIRGCCWDGKSPYRVSQCYKVNGVQDFDVNLEKVPAAYKPALGTCNVNIYQIPLLYYSRVACHYRFRDYLAGYDVLSIPNRLDCLTKLGCCYEDDETVVEAYPFIPRCYQREGGHFARPAGLPAYSTQLFRSGDGIGLPEFPPNMEP